MAVSLSKGGRVNLSKENPGLKKVRVCLGWDTNKYDGGYDFDLDAAAFLTGPNGKVTTETDFVFYNNKLHPSGSVEHMGDNRTGDGEGDDEEIVIDLEKVPQNITGISFTVTIHEAGPRGQNFGMVSNAYVRIVDDTNNKEVVHYDLEEDFSRETAIVVGELYRKDGDWRFKAIGEGFNGGLAALCANFGIDAA